MGLNEQSIDKNFEFVAKAEAAMIFEKMSNLIGKPEEDRNSALIEYLLKVNKWLILIETSRSAIGSLLIDSTVAGNFALF